MSKVRFSTTLGLAALIFFGLASPLFAWYYFTASNSNRKAWVFNTSCNPDNSQINLYVDSDTPSAEQLTLTTTTTWGSPVITDWNEPFGGATISLMNTTIDTSTSMDSDSVVSYYSSPVAGRIWIVYDSTGDVFSRFGIDPDSGVLGIGLSFEQDGANPQNICSGLILINAYYINKEYGSNATKQYKVTVLHELGHTLGFAHSVSAGNRLETVGQTTAGIPVMYPFSYTSGPTSLQNDDHAGAKAVYGQ